MRHIVICILLFLLAGCAVNNNKNTAYERDTDQIISVKHTTHNEGNTKLEQGVASHLAKLASSIPNVNNATAVAIGSYAVVGIDVDAKLDRSRVESIKYSVAESLKHDPHGANAVVVADPDTYERLRQMGKQIKNGKPEGVMEELAAIVGRIIPQIPNDLLENKNPEPTKQNNDQLDSDEQNKLRKEQEDQSNHQMNQ